VTFSDPVLHHDHKPGWQAQIESFTNEYDSFPVAFDQDGCRYDPQAAKVSHGSEPNRIAFLGDSFVEAYQVPYAQSFVAQVEKEFGTRAWVRNYGVTSYSPILSLLQWRTKIKEWKPTQVVFMLYTNDVDRSTALSDADYLKGAVLDASGEVVAIPGTESKIEGFLRQFHLAWELMRAYRGLQHRALHPKSAGESAGAFIEPNPDVIEPTPSILLKMKKEVEATGARFVLTVVPSKLRNLKSETKYEEPEFSDKWKAWAASQSVEFIDLAAPFRDHTAQHEPLFFSEDIHFNPDGHKVTAQVISGALKPVLK
jgi:lysophospholipase L1-like esterase